VSEYQCSPKTALDNGVKSDRTLTHLKEVGMVDTNDYIYRFLNGNLGENRKHSEVVNKILAGYIDSDGTVSIHRNEGTLRISLTLSQAAVNDPDFEILRAFHKFYGLGTLHFRFSDVEGESSRCDWKLSIADTIKLFNLLGKHLIVKGTLLRDCIKLYEENKGKKLSDAEYEVICNTRDTLRSSSGPLKRKKHPSWAWLAGYIAGDGHLCCRLNRKRRKYDKKVDKYYDMTYNELYVVIVSDIRGPLDFLMEHLNGSVYAVKDSYFQWKRSLGKGNLKFSEEFLSKLKPYMLHPKKYRAIQRMLKHLRASRD